MDFEDEEFIGIFWGLIETRPFMRTKHISSRIYCGFCGTVLTRRNWN